MEALGKAADHVHDLFRRPCVEVAGRLVGEHHLGVRDECARDAHALLLTAGHLVGKVIHAVFESHAAEHFLCLEQPHVRVDALEHERHGDIFRRRQLRQQIVGLKNKADVLLPEGRKLIFVEL